MAVAKEEGTDTQVPPAPAAKKGRKGMQVPPAPAAKKGGKGMQVPPAPAVEEEGRGMSDSFSFASLPLASRGWTYIFPMQ